jgi:hypothetical protein
MPILIQEGNTSPATNPVEPGAVHISPSTTPIVPEASNANLNLGVALERQGVGSLKREMVVEDPRAKLRQRVEADFYKVLNVYKQATTQPVSTFFFKKPIGPKRRKSRRVKAKINKSKLVREKPREVLRKNGTSAVNRVLKA